MSAEPGWYPDPDGRGERYWSGDQWTEQIRPATSAASAQADEGSVSRVWRWCRAHPKTSIGAAATVVLLVVAAAVSDAQPGPSTAGGPDTSTSARPSVSQSPSTSRPAASRSPQTTRVSTAAADRRQRSTTTAVGLLTTLPVKGRAPKTGYSRDQFGPAWTDATPAPLGHNGCDTRNDILRRDLVPVQVKPGTNGCVTLTGTLHDPYTSAVIAFRRGVWCLSVRTVTEVE